MAPCPSRAEYNMGGRDAMPSGLVDRNARYGDYTTQFEYANFEVT